MGDLPSAQEPTVGDPLDRPSERRPRDSTAANPVDGVSRIETAIGADAAGPGNEATPEPADNGSRIRTAATGAITVLACLLVWLVLIAPNQISRLTPIAFVRIPIEGLLVVALVLVLPQRGKRVAAALVGVVLALLMILKILDMGFFEALGRPFNPVFDRGYFRSAEGLLSDSIGRRDAIVFLVAAGALVVAILIVMPLAVLRLTRLVDRHRATSIRAVAALGLVWSLCAVSGVQLASDTPAASRSAISLVHDRISQVRASLRDQQALKREADADAFRDVPGKDLLTGLRGKDVIVVFVESYGRVALEGSPYSSQVDSVLDAGTSRLREAGLLTQSAWLTSPTFGGISWLAHSTLQSGLWIDNQKRYDHIVASDRFTLSGAFKRAGWRTVGDVPSNDRDWPVGSSFYHYDQIYDSRNVGYVGPKFSYASMPDQYILSAFQRLELAKPNRAPVMAEIDLVSSHTPWAPLPHMIDWSDIGDGAVFENMPGQGQSPEVVWRDPNQVRAAYGRSIEYSLNSVISFVQTFHDNNLVLIVLGDHQPATIVSGDGASRDVPITIIANDPAVMNRISRWGWQDGMRPGPNAVVWPMNAFRDRFLTAFGPQPH